MLENFNINNHEVIPIDSYNLQNFLIEWDNNYLTSLRTIDLFIPERTSNWPAEQKKFFAKVFYHARGHFHEFLWLLANFAEDKETKDIVLRNIAEEFNSSALSHEQLYCHFAESLGVDLSDEIIEQTSYLPVIKDFNKGHLRWLKNHNALERFAAFTAYERLDNLDYTLLWKFAQTLGINKKGMIFFKIHMHADHFKTTQDKLALLWKEDQEKVKEAYEFIAQHQRTMWTNLSQAVASYT